MRGLVVRPIEDEDLRPLFLLGKESLDQDTFLYPWTKEECALIYTAANSLCLGAFVKKKLLAFAMATLESPPGCARINYFTVKKGLESVLPTLFKTLYEGLKSRKANAIVVDIPIKNQDIFTLLQTLGFSGAPTAVRMTRTLE